MPYTFDKTAASEVGTRIKSAPERTRRERIDSAGARGFLPAGRPYSPTDIRQAALAARRADGEDNFGAAPLNSDERSSGVAGRERIFAKRTYTEPMQAIRPFWGRRVVLPALACFLGFTACRISDQDEAALLFSQLPGNQAMQLYLDVERLRSSPGLAEIIAAKPDDASMFPRINRELGVNVWRDVDSLAGSLGTGALTLAVSGNFRQGRIQQHLSDKGAKCATFLGSPECVQESAGANYIVWLGPAQENFLAASSGPSVEAIRELRRNRDPNYVSLASEMRASMGNSDFLWIGIDARRLEVAMRSPPEDWINLSLLANALRHAHRAVATAGPGADGRIEFHLRALCSSAEEAESQSALLKGLFSFAAAALDAGGGEKPAENSWSAFLRSAEVSAVESRAEARMLLGAERLTQLLALR